MLTESEHDLCMGNVCLFKIVLHIINKQLYYKDDQKPLVLFDVNASLKFYELTGYTPLCASCYNTIQKKKPSRRKMKSISVFMNLLTSPRCEDNKCSQTSLADTAINLVRFAWVLSQLTSKETNMKHSKQFECWKHL